MSHMRKLAHSSKPASIEQKAEIDLLNKTIHTLNEKKLDPLLFSISVGEVLLITKCLTPLVSYLLSVSLEYYYADVIKKCDELYNYIMQEFDHLSIMNSQCDRFNIPYDKNPLSCVTILLSIDVFAELTKKVPGLAKDLSKVIALASFLSTHKDRVSNIEELDATIDTLQKHYDTAKLTQLAYSTYEKLKPYGTDPTVRRKLFFPKTLGITEFTSTLLMLAGGYFLQRTRIKPWLSKKFVADEKIGYQDFQLTAIEASDIIKFLNKRKNELRPTAKKYQFYSFLLNLFYLYFIQKKDLTFSELLVHFIINLTFINLGNIADAYKDYRFDAQFKEMETQLNRATQDCQATKVDSHKDSYFFNSYFVFNAKRYESLSSYCVNQAVKNIFLKNGIEILHYKQARIIVGYDRRIDQKLANKMNAEIKDYLNRRINIVRLKKQMEKIADAMDQSFATIFDRDKNDLLSATFLLPISDIYLNELSEIRTKSMFAKNYMELSLNNMVIVRGYHPLDEADFALLEFAIKKIKSAQKKTPVKIETPTTSETNKSNTTTHKKILQSLATKEPKSERKENKGDAKENHSKPQTTPHEFIIKWKSAEYNSAQHFSFSYMQDTTTPPPVPIESPCLPKNKFFVLFALKPEHFPNEPTYSAFRKKTLQAKLATKKGEEGLRFIGQWERDTNKKWFWASLDVKLLGQNFGDIRAYGSKDEPSKTGEILFVVKGLNMHAH